jgi:ATP-dependent helicase/DNAse subunit B
MLQYISYYHVAEHWFENIYQDDLVEQIQLAITSPEFSYKRKKDVRQLIRKISKAVQLRNDELVIDERVALRLTLSRYVDISQLISELRNFDAGLLDYYANHVVGFCNADKVVFDQNDISNIFISLANRIYKTRNALVHSKEGSKGKFVPFSDDQELIPEVPLVRFIAEQIITASSTIPGTT